jgi:hypothetical protein
MIRQKQGHVKYQDAEIVPMANETSNCLAPAFTLYQEPAPDRIVPRDGALASKHVRVAFIYTTNAKHFCFALVPASGREEYGGGSYFLVSMAMVRLLAVSALGRRIFSTPSSNDAFTPSALTVFGRLKLRSKRP